MTPETYSPISSSSRTSQDDNGFQLWTAEFSNLDYGSSNLTQGVYRFFSLLFAGYDYLADVLNHFGKGRSVEIVEVSDANPVLLVAPIAEDRRAA